jgi:hypothetical protein
MSIFQKLMRNKMKIDYTQQKKSSDLKLNLKPMSLTPAKSNKLSQQKDRYKSILGDKISEVNEDEYSY